MQALLSWCLEHLDLGSAADCEFTMVSGDASFRKYYRLRHAGQSWIAVLAPPDKENNEAFVAVRELLAESNLPVPELYAWDQPRGFLLLSDLGDQLLLPLLTEKAVDGHYRRAMALIQDMQSVPCNDLPAYDAQRLKDEMNLLPQWFIEALLEYQLSAEEQSLLGRCFDCLAGLAVAQPQVFVHRDYHSRNIMVLNGESSPLGLIDFQDAVSGPATYDLVSLLRDCYIAWPQAQVREWALAFKAASPRLCAQGDDEFMRDFDAMGLQRHIKVLGIFARLSIRDGKSAYLDDLPLVLHYTLTVAKDLARRYPQQYPVFAEFVDWFELRLLPLVKQQHWYRALA